ncbi:hypothetical protein AAII07_57625 [Microvirga sp. 0TCS3.31]
MHRALSSVIALLGGIALSAPAVAEVSIVVDKSIQPEPAARSWG